MTNATLELPAPDDGADRARGSIFFVGTATVVLRYAGFTILTDPNFLHRGDHVHLGYGITSRRQTEPAMDFDDLPAVDFVLLSHYHGDHFDRLVEERLDRSTPIVTTRHAANQLTSAGFTATHPLDTWETLSVRKGDAELDVTAMPGTHAPSVLSKALPQVMGSMLEFKPTGDDTEFRLYVSGDTLMHDALEEIPKRFPEIDVALLHLGGTKVFGVLLTMDAEQGVEAVRLFDADASIPIHTDDYDVFESPRSEFEDAVADAGLNDRVSYLDRGETYRFDVREDRAWRE